MGLQGTSSSRIQLSHLRKRNRANSATEGMTKGSIKSYVMTRASFYTHFMDMRADSQTFGKRVPIGS